MKTNYYYCKFCNDIVPSNHSWEMHYEKGHPFRKFIGKLNAYLVFYDANNAYTKINEFLSKVNIADNGCWIWNDNSQSMYGKFYCAGRLLPVHRFTYFIHNGVLPGEEYDVHHKCENKLCCNPDDLEALTAGEHRVLHKQLRRKRTL